MNEIDRRRQRRDQDLSQEQAAIEYGRSFRYVASSWPNNVTKV
jgi:hypothetical protein